MAEEEPSMADEHAKVEEDPANVPSADAAETDPAPVDGDGDGGAADGAVEDADADAKPAPKPKHACLNLAWKYPEHAIPVSEVGSIGLPPIIASVDCDCDAEEILNASSADSDRVAKFVLAPRRLARSHAHQRYNDVKVALIRAEHDYAELKGFSGTPKEEVLLKEEKMKEIESLRADCEEAKQALDDFKSTLDAKAMAPWKSALISAVEAGMTCLTTSPKVDSVGYPTGLLKRAVDGVAPESAYKDSETLLGGFNEQCAGEKGAAPGVIVNLCPPLQFKTTAASAANDEEDNEGGAKGAYERMLEGACERLKVDKATACLLHWYDFSPEGVDGALAAMLELSAMRRKKKVGLIGVSGFPADVVQVLLDSGVDINIVSAPYNLIDQRASLKLIPMCKEYGIIFLANHATAYGYLSTDPNTHTGCSNMRSLRSPVDADAYKALLTKLGGVGKQYNLSVEVVAIRWILDQGVIPVVPISFSKPEVPADEAKEEGESGEDAEEEDKENKDASVHATAEAGLSTHCSEAEASACWAPFGARGHLKGEPGFDSRLLAPESFMLRSDLEALTEAGMRVGHTGDAGEIESGMCGFRVAA